MIRDREPAMARIAASEVSNCEDSTANGAESHLAAWIGWSSRCSQRSFSALITGARSSGS